MTTKDYSRAVGWWCPTCHFEHETESRYDAFFCGHTGSGPATRCIPVFEPLPVPEPGADEPEWDTVVTHASRGGGVMIGLGPETSTQMREDERWAFKTASLRGNGYEPDEQSKWEAVKGKGMDDGARSAGLSLGAAVIWVAEGALP